MAKAKEIEGLDCDAGVVAGAKMVLRTRLEEMCALREAALNWDDIEGVHDMRVASRRLRSAIRDFASYFRKHELRRMADDVKRLADALGDVRDRDVVIAGLEKISEDAPPEVVEGIRKITNQHRGCRDTARAKLAGLIDACALTKFEQECLAAIDKAQARRPFKNNDRERVSASASSFRQAGRDIILDGWRDLRERSASLHRPLKAKPLHKMRITAKRLRYAIELFCQCQGADASLRPIAKELSKLQSSLGELHDCDVWIEDLGARLGALVVERDASPATAPRDADGANASLSQETLEAQRAAVWLMCHFNMQRTKSFHDALTRWHAWQADDFERQLFQQLST